MTTCNESVKQGNPKNVYQLRETLFDKLHPPNVPYRHNQRLLNNMVVFDFESICAGYEAFKDTETTTWIGKRIPLSAPLSSNLINELIFFLCNHDPRDMVSSFNDALERSVARQNKAQLKNNFLEIEKVKKSRLARILEALNICRNNFVGIEAEETIPKAVEHKFYK